MTYTVKIVTHGENKLKMTLINRKKFMFMIWKSIF